MNLRIPTVTPSVFLTALLIGVSSYSGGQTGSASGIAPGAPKSKNAKAVDEDVAKAQQEGMASVAVPGKLLDEIEAKSGKQTFRITTLRKVTFSDGTKLPAQTVLDGLIVPADSTSATSSVTVQVNSIEASHKKTVPVNGFLHNAVSILRVQQDDCESIIDKANCNAFLGQGRESMDGVIRGIRIDSRGSGTTFSSIAGPGTHVRLKTGTYFTIVLAKEKGLAID